MKAINTIDVYYNGRIGEKMVLKEAEPGNNPSYIATLIVSGAGGANLVPRNTAKQMAQRFQGWSESEERRDGVKLRLNEDKTRFATSEEVRYFIEKGNEAGKPITKLPNMKIVGGISREAKLRKENAQLRAQLAQQNGNTPIDNTSPDKPEEPKEETKPSTTTWPEGFVPAYESPENGGQVAANTKKFNKWKQDKLELESN